MITPMQIPAVGPGSVIDGLQKEMIKFNAVISKGMRRASYKLDCDDQQASAGLWLGGAIQEVPAKHEA